MKRLALLAALVATPAIAQDLTDAQQAALDNMLAIANDTATEAQLIMIGTCLVGDASPEELEIIAAAEPGDDLEPTITPIMFRKGFATCLAAAQ